MRPRQKRFIIIASGFAMLGLAAVLILTALEENILFFHSPSDLVKMQTPPAASFRVGGLVKLGSVKRDGDKVNFIITDFENELAVRYRGILPDLFREGQGVVAEGRLAEDGAFAAALILAKHDENYMPPEVADSLSPYGYKK